MILLRGLRIRSIVRMHSASYHIKIPVTPTFSRLTGSNTIKRCFMRLNGGVQSAANEFMDSEMLIPPHPGCAAAEAGAGLVKRQRR